jgi:outer membrane protein OmpA-like peptidoglycan-associated protein
MAGARHRHILLAAAATLLLGATAARAGYQNNNEVVIDTSVLQGLEVRNQVNGRPVPALAKPLKPVRPTLTLEDAEPTPEAAALANGKQVAPARITGDNDDLGKLRVFPVTERLIRHETLDPTAGVSAPAVRKKKPAPPNDPSLDPSLDPSQGISAKLPKAPGGISIPDSYAQGSAGNRILSSPKISSATSSPGFTANGVPVPGRKPGSGFANAMTGIAAAAIEPASGDYKAPAAPVKQAVITPPPAPQRKISERKSPERKSIERPAPKIATGKGRNNLPLSAAPTHRYGVGDGYQLRGAATMPAVPKGRVYAEPLDKLTNSTEDQLERQLVHLAPQQVLAAVEQVQKNIGEKPRLMTAVPASKEAVAAANRAPVVEISSLDDAKPAMPFPPPRKVKKAKREDKGIIRIDAIRNFGERILGIKDDDDEMAEIPQIAPAPERIMAQKANSVKTYANITPSSGVATVQTDLSVLGVANMEEQPRKGTDREFVMLAYERGQVKVADKAGETVRAHILGILKKHPGWRVEIQSYASPNDPANSGSAKRISLDRAMAMRSWLVSQGIEDQRVEVRARGMMTDRQPADRIDFMMFDPGKV